MIINYYPTKTDIMKQYYDTVQHFFKATNCYLGIHFYVHMILVLLLYKIPKTISDLVW